MALKVYTQEEVDAILPDKNGKRYFPTGDYSAIKEFGSRCYFNSDCIFGSECNFGDLNIFGHCCIFGFKCSFGWWCEFSGNCNFGSECSFGYRTDFGSSCKFGKKCVFENTYRAKTKLPFITLGGCGSEARTCYFYDFEEGIRVRAGCFFGTLKEFKAKVLEDEETPDTPSKKTKAYLAFCDLAENQFK